MLQRFTWHRWLYMSDITRAGLSNAVQWVKCLFYGIWEGTLQTKILFWSRARIHKFHFSSFCNSTHTMRFNHYPYVQARQQLLCTTLASLAFLPSWMWSSHLASVTDGSITFYDVYDAGSITYDVYDTLSDKNTFIVYLGLDFGVHTIFILTCSYSNTISLPFLLLLLHNHFIEAREALPTPEFSQSFNTLKLLTTSTLV